MSFDEQHLRIENARLRDEVKNKNLENKKFCFVMILSHGAEHFVFFVWLQIDRISGIAAKYVGKPLSSFSHLSSVSSRCLDLGVGNFGAQSGFVGEMYGAGDLLRSVSVPSEADKPMIVELAVAAMEELMRTAQAGEPLWVAGDNSTEILSEEEYLRTFPRGIGPKPLGLTSEASRESAVVIMNHINLVEILMDVVINFSS